MILFISTTSFNFIQAQSNTPNRYIEIDLLDSLLISDSLYIIPESVRIISNHNTNIQIAVQAKSIYLINPTRELQHIKLFYTLLSASPNIIISSSDTLNYNAIHEVIPMSNKFQQKDIHSSKLPSNEVEYSGAFGRGLSFGNNQNLVLNSALDVQISGKLGDDIEINAAITDQNLPIQADGNTAQLNEIDKVYIELKKNNQKLVAGDLQLQPDQTYFLRYHKKYKGLLFNSKDSLKNGATLNTSFGAAIARGNFRRQTLTIIEGNQGPYRLIGNTNDLFIIVLSASEKVYLDGMILNRGLENDYIIDYNRAEISFTAKHLINRNSRIVIEFEYSNQSYLKSAWTLQSRYQSNKLSIQWNSYQESDNKTSNIAQTLTSADIQTLQDAGDLTNQLNRSTIKLSDQPSETNTVSYKTIDTIVNGIKYDNILIIDLKGNKINYTAQFNYLGSHRGNYVIENNLFTNGRAYRWVAPDPTTKIAGGEYEPIVSLTAPKKQSQHSLQINYRPSSGIYSSSEISLSNLNLNLYSNKDQSDNLGIAWKQITGYNRKIKNSTAVWSNEISLENQSTTFNYFEPYRNPEFNRDWSIDPNYLNRNGDFLSSIHTALTHTNYEIGYQFRNYSNQQLYHGAHHSWNARYNRAGTNLKFYGSALFNDAKELLGKFIRPHLEIIQNLSHQGTQRLGIAIANETNKQINKIDQSLFPTSFSFQSIKAFYKGSLPKLKMDYNVEYTNRMDEQIAIDRFTEHTQSQDLIMEHNWQINKNSNWAFRLGDRKLSFNKINTPWTEKNTNTLILRQSFNTKSSNQVLKYYETIESNSGQEPAIEYTYIKVNKGQGYYTWIDANKDSIIQVTEFELAPFSDLGEYIRYAVTGTEFVKTRNYLFLQNFEFDGSKIGNLKNQNLLQKIGFISNINYNWKIAESTNGFIPIDLQNPHIISAQGQIRNQFYFNRGNPHFELQAGKNSSATKWRLATGFETRNTNELFIRTRHKLNNSFSIENYIAQTQQKNIAELFIDKNYDIQSHIIEPKINYQSNNLFRISTTYRYKSGKEYILGTRSSIHEVKVEIIALPKSPWSFRGSLASICASLKGKQNPLTEYSMLQGLRAGFNALFQINIDRQINTNTILRLGYDGRKSEGSKYIQTGRAQVVASF